MARKRTSSTKRWRDQAKRKRQEDKAQRRADRHAAKTGSSGSSEDAPLDGEPPAEDAQEDSTGGEKVAVQESPGSAAGSLESQGEDETSRTGDTENAEPPGGSGTRETDHA